MPMMSNMTLFLTHCEKTKIMLVTTIAPTKAASKIAIAPPTLNKAVDMLPPMANITSATPNPAPLLIPKIEGPAKGF